MNTLVVLALAVGAGFASIRWLRVAQREHYLAGSVTRFAWRWWRASPLATVLAGAGIIGAVITFAWAAGGVVLAAVMVWGPPGLTLRGITSPLAWTDRLRRLAVVVGVVLATAVAAGIWFGPGITAVVVMATPVVVDLGLWLVAPWERRMGRGWVEAAGATLAESDATVVAITGSYGKTSTKGYVAQLLGGSKRVLASPASFNNRMGLARAINEHMAPGIEVFVAEMGTYGPGEIADLCEWITPDIVVITAIGPVHLERFGSEDQIVKAKSEILTPNATAVLNASDERLAKVAATESSRRRTISVGTTPGLDVSVVAGTVRVGDREVGAIPATAHPSNVACAMGVVVALGIDPNTVADRLTELKEPDHRLTTTVGTSGVAIIDDTFNSNPAGAEAALNTLAGTPVIGRRAVVTPGMVELGHRQAAENRLFAERAGNIADYLLIVGRTNRAALVAGAEAAPAQVLVMDDRNQAVEWVRTNLGPDDAVLYENDLPDHYP